MQCFSIEIPLYIIRIGTKSQAKIVDYKLYKVRGNIGVL
jgi:hypothetical protein